jgi:Tfp pilus assembly protein PilF
MRVRKRLWLLVIVVPIVITALYLNHVSAHWVPDADKKVKEAQKKLAEDAFAEIEKVALAQPDSAKAQTDYAQALLQRNAYIAAVLPAERAVKSDPRDPNSHLLLAMIYSTLGYRSRALDQYKQTLKLAPNNMEAMQRLGEYLLALRETQEAEQVFLRAEKAAPQASGPRMSLASLYTGERRAEDALAVLEPTIADIKQAPVGALYLAARACSTLGKTQIGCDMLREAIRRQPNFADAYHTLGGMLCNQAKYAEGIPLLEKAAELAPNEASHRYSLGNGFFNDSALPDRLPCARSAYEAALEIDPQDPWTHYYYGFTLEQMGEKDAAMREYDRALEIQSNFDSAWYRKGAIYTAEGNIAEAKRCYAIFDKRSKQAITDVHSKRHHDSIVDTAPAHFQRGMAFLRHGDKAKAIADFEVAIQLDPKYSPAKRALQDTGGQ